MHWLLRKYPFLLVLAITTAYAQHPSKLNRFSVPFERGCAPVTIHVSTSPGFLGFTNSYYYEDGLLDVNDTFHTYSNPGIYQIVQLTQETIQPKTDTLVFEVVPSDLPRFNIYECGTQTVVVDIEDGNYDFYRVYFTANDSVDFLSGDPPPSHTYPSNSVGITVKGLYQNSYSNCGELFKSINLINNLPLAIISNADFTPVCGQLFDLSISAASEETLKYQIDLSYGGGPFNTIYEGLIVNNSITIPNVVNTGNSDFCLRINTVDPCSNTVQNGPIYCNSIPSSYFTFLSDAYATYAGSKTEIQFNALASQQVIVNKGTSTGFSLLDTVMAPGIFPSNPSGSYLLVLIDTCQMILDSALISAPYLTINNRNFDTNELDLSMTDGLNEFTETSRELMFYSEDSSIVEVIAFDTKIKLSPSVGSTQRIRGRIWYNEISNPIYSNEITARYVYRIYVPTAFTPNHDGLNDRLQFFGIISNDAEVTIYNRWGQRIHYTNNLSTGWNGYIDNELAPEGAYNYEINFTSPDGEEIHQVGTFALINK